MKKLLYLFLFINFTVTYSQVPSVGGEGINLPVITSPPPGAFSFSKYGNVPVGYHTGVANISVPIYTIQTNSGFKLPLNLSYHASGIRVDEIAGKTGLGWNLFTGGKITLKVNGKRDGGNLYLNAAEFSALNQNGGTISPNEYLYEYVYKVYKGEVDSNPDSYSFSFAGHSGEFFVDSNYQVHQIPASGLRITTDQSLSHFEITDGHGNIFYFGLGSSSTKDPSGCQYTSLDDPIDSMNQSYFLKKITMANNEIIDFFYRTISYSYKSAIVQTEFDVIYTSSSGCENISDRNCENLVNANEHLLTKINFPKGSLNFTYSDELNFGINNNSTRMDLPGGVALRAITIRDNSGTERSNFLFNYDYFKSFGVGSESYRLKLLSVIKNSIEEFSFDYYEDEMLPKRLSFAQDYWGYYNGNLSNTSIIPEMQYGGETYSGGNREIGALQFVRANSLKRITYPTKGWSEFDYESNDFYSSNHTSTTTYDESFSLSSTEFTNLIASKIGYQNQQGEITDFQLELFNGCSNNSGPGGLGESYSVVQLRDNNQNLIGTYTASGTYQINPNAGDFSQMTLQMENSGDCDCTAIVSWKRTLTETVSGNFKGSGIRISQIVNSSDSGIPVIKNYDYNIPGTTKSSGTRSDDPIFHKLITAPGNPDNEGTPNTTSKCTFLVRQNSPYFALNNKKGQSVGYSYVNETISGNGSTQFRYRNMGVSPITSRGWKSGQLLEKTIFDLSGNPLFKEEYTYVFDETFVPNSSNYFSGGGDVLAYGISVSFNELKHLGFDTYQPVLNYEFVYLTSAWEKNTAVIKTTFDENGQVVQNITKVYNNYHNLLPTNIQIINSENEVISTDYYYPDDINSNSSLPGGILSASEYSAINRMKSGDLHMTEKLIQIIRNENGAKGFKRYSYLDLNTPVVLNKLKTGKGIEPLSDRIEYLRYDPHGNPLEVSRAEGPSVIYIWGYDDQYPIAKIENADYIDIANQLNAVSGDLSNIDHTDLPAINGLRGSLPNAMITTYTYKPLIGISTITDPKGKTTTYHYDSFNRLEFIKDEDGNILQEYKYHYKELLN